MSTDVALGAVTVCMAILGAVISIWPPQKNRTRVTYFLIFLLSGYVTFRLIRTQAEEATAAQAREQQRAHEAEKKLDTMLAMIQGQVGNVARQKTGGLKTKMDVEPAVSAERGEASPKTDVAVVDKAEADRRRRLILLLRYEYILSHDGISPALMAGTEPLPKEWVEKRLSQLGETWRQESYNPLMYP